MSGFMKGGNKGGNKGNSPKSAGKPRAGSLEEEEDLPGQPIDPREAARRGLLRAGATRHAPQAAARVVDVSVGRISLFSPDGKLDLANLRFGNPVYETRGEVTDKPEIKASWWKGLLANVPVLNKIALSEATRKAIDDANAQLDADLHKIDQEVAGLGGEAMKKAREMGFRNSMQRFSMRVQEAIQKDPAPELKKQDWKTTFEKTWESFSKNFALLMGKLGAVASSVRKGVTVAATSAADRVRSAAFNLKQKAEDYTKDKTTEAAVRSARVGSVDSNASGNLGRADSGAKKPAFLDQIKGNSLKAGLKKVQTNDRSAPNFSEPQSNVKPAVPARPAGLSFGNKQQGNSPKAAAASRKGSFTQDKPASPKGGSTGNPAMDFARVAASKQQSNLKRAPEKAQQAHKPMSELDKKLQERRKWEQQGNQSPKSPKSKQ